VYPSIPPRTRTRVRGLATRTLCTGFTCEKEKEHRRAPHPIHAKSEKGRTITTDYSAGIFGDDGLETEAWARAACAYAGHRRPAPGTLAGIAYTEWLESLPPAEAAAEIEHMFALCAAEDLASDIASDLQMHPAKARLIADAINSARLP
jgi:hypothetical protein